MPVVSKSQLRAMQAAAKGKSVTGIPKAVALEYLLHTTPAVTAKLPERVAKRTAPTKKTK